MCEQGTMAEVIINGKSISIDSCIAQQVKDLNERFKNTLISIGCCCGHGKYPPSIVVKELNTGRHYEFFSGIEITRRRNLYYRDQEGIFHLPEVSEIREISTEPHETEENDPNPI